MPVDNDIALPTISVILPVHNGRDTLSRCLEALTAGEGEVPEVVLVDDASTDGTAELAACFPVRLIRLDTNRGPAAARNLGVEAANGQILLFIDADVEVQPFSPNIETYFTTSYIKTPVRRRERSGVVVGLSDARSF